MSNSTGSEERALVQRLGQAQREKLRLNRHRTHWREWGRNDWYLRRMFDEMMELWEAVRAGASAEAVWKEAGDIANFAAMIADRHEQGKP